MAQTLPVPVGLPSGATCTDRGVGVKPVRCQRRRRILWIAHEVADMIEKNLIAFRQLAIVLFHCDIMSHRDANSRCILQDITTSSD